MHFYDFNIGDYAKKTPHLTNEEDLAYRRALDLYYDTEKPLPINESGGLSTLSRRLRVGIESLQNVVNEFFPDGVNKHADEKIAAYHAYLDKQSANGKRGGRPKTKEIKPTDNPPLSQNNPVPSQPLTTKPLTTNQDNTHSATESPVKYSKAFLAFWDLYPNRKNKGAAFKAFKKINQSEYVVIKDGLESAKKSKEWEKDNGQYIPHPASWLNARGWEDESHELTKPFDVNEFMKKASGI